MVDLGGLRSEQEELVVVDAGDGELADDAPLRVEHRRSGRCGPIFGSRLVNRPCSHVADARAADTRYLAKLEHSVSPTRSRTARHSSATTSNALERRNVTSSTGSSPGRWNHSGCSRPKPAPHTALCSVRRSYIGVVCSGRAGRQLLVGERDAEAAAVVLAHLGVGVGERGPVAVAGDVHRPRCRAAGRPSSSSWRGPGRRRRPGRARPSPRTPPSSCGCRGSGRPAGCRRGRT